MILKELTIAETNASSVKELELELKDEGFSSYKWTDSPGAYYPPHNHEHDECISVLSGKISFFVKGKEYELQFGKKLYLPAGTVHEAKNKSDQNVTYLIGEMN